MRIRKLLVILHRDNTARLLQASILNRVDTLHNKVGIPHNRATASTRAVILHSNREATRHSKVTASSKGIHHSKVVTPRSRSPVRAMDSLRIGK